MISYSGNKGFFAAHYDWIALGVGILALIAGGAFYGLTLGADPEEAASASVADVERMKPNETGVKPIDMTALQNATSVPRKPQTVVEVSEKAASFLASERRVMCKCKKVISGDVKAFPKCPYCGEKQEEEQKIVLDADGDGMADEWEKKFGLNPNNPADASADNDGDEFTNLEEYLAKTDPTNKADHPDYLDSLTITLPLKETYMPFIFLDYSKIPTGWRCVFFDPVRKDDYGRKGATLTAVVGSEIPGTGYVVKNLEKKEAKREIKGAAGMTKTVDVSEATVERKSDGKVMKIVRAENKRQKPAAVDVQATLVYERGTAKNIDVVPGSEIVLSGVKYKISGVKAVGKGAEVTVENPLTGKKRVLKAE